MEQDEPTPRLEEADMRILPHMYHGILHGYKQIIVTSNDSDVFALILFYMPRFLLDGLVELWLKFRTGTNTRFLLMHILCEKLGHEMCSVLLKAHILTGCDVTSKIGTKNGALKADPQRYLRDFRETEELRIEEA